ncbi:hypothetical protein BH09ACT8_BH09ACT8_03520 [soil metagenome]
MTESYLYGGTTVLAEAGSHQSACRPGMVGDGIRADFAVND